MISNYAKYPSQAVFNVNNFITVGSASYTSDGSTTTYVLPSLVGKPADVLLFAGGILQEPGMYTMANLNGIQYGSIQLIYPFDAGVPVYIKTISVPGIFLKTVSTQNFQISNINYSNSAPVTVNGNAYIVNGTATTFALPAAATTSNKNEIFVWLDGVMQHPSEWTYPSGTLANRGITFNSPVYRSANIHIRVIEYSSNITSGLYRAVSMSDRKPDRGISMATDFTVKGFESQAGYETRRLISRRFKRSFDLTYTNITGMHKEAIENFYKNRYGGWEAFMFDLAHINLSGNCLVKFDGKLETEQVASLSSYDITKQIWTVRFTLTETNN